MSFKTAKMLVLMVGIAGISMGNQKCQESQDRVLRMDVEVGKIGAQTLRMPSGEVIDFPYLANSLFYMQVMNDPHFVMSNPLPPPTQPTATSKVSAKVKANPIMSEDEAMLYDFGFIDRGAPASSGKVAAKAAAAVADLPTCLYESPQSKLDGNIISFESTWGAGIGIGYGANGSVLPSGGVAGSVNFKQAKLTMGLRASDPLMNILMASAEGVSHQADLKFGLDLLNPALGLDFIYKTPLVDVVKKGMSKSLDAVVKSFTNMMSERGSWDDVWESRVLYQPVIVDNDTTIAFRGGYRNNMKEGDTFVVSNMHYEWEGKACASRLKYAIPTTPTPVAEVEVIKVSPNAAVAKVTRYLIDQVIKPGAQIKILALKQPPKPVKKK
ncbi:MAG TPA: hypothetical protein VM432_01955 [Bdellovibrionales bacterium]|nr:hypothetical protein [Bdellovibrionales bacterium]